MQIYQDVETLDQSPEEDESASTEADQSDEELDDDVAEDLRKFQESFRGISKRYKLMNRIGEGKTSNLGALAAKVLI